MSRSPLFLNIRFDRFLGILLRVLMAGHAANRDIWKRCLEVILTEREIRYHQVVRNVLAAVKDLLCDPEG